MPDVHRECVLDFVLASSAELALNENLDPMGGTAATPEPTSGGVHFFLLSRLGLFLPRQGDRISLPLPGALPCPHRGAWKSPTRVQLSVWSSRL